MAEQTLGSMGWPQLALLHDVLPAEGGTVTVTSITSVTSTTSVSHLPQHSGTPRCRGAQDPPFPRRCRGAPLAASSPGPSRLSQPCLARSLSVIARLPALRGCGTDHHMMLQVKWKMRCAGCIPHRRARLLQPCSAARAHVLRSSSRRPRPSAGTGPPGTAGTGAWWDRALSSGTRCKASPRPGAWVQRCQGLGAAPQWCRWCSRATRCTEQGLGGPGAARR